MRLAIIILFTTLILPMSVFADTLTVPGEYPAIQAAIEDAKDGDLVLVDPGTYLENLDLFGKEITVQSTGGMDVTVVDGGLSGSVVTFGSGETSATVLDGFKLINGYADDGGGIHCSDDSSPIIRNCRITKNEAYFYGGGIYINGSNPLIEDCQIHVNNAWDGAGINCYESSPTILRTRIYGNIAAGFGGGGIYCYNESNLKLINTMIYKNKGSTGAGILCGLSSPELTNCVMSENAASYSGGAICLFSYSLMRITNSIIYYNAAPLDWQICLLDLSTALVKHSNIQDETGWPGLNNIKSNPRFVNESGGDFHLLPTSTCIDKGTNLAPDLPETDFEGDPRIIDGDDNKVLTVDMGVDELWYLRADNHVIENSVGGTVNFDLDARPENADRTYLIIGGATGFTPGWNLGQVVLPVNHDPVTDFMLTLINSPAFADFLGSLNFQGKATAQLNVPPLQPGLGNFTLYFAYALNFPINYVSNHVEIEFTE